MWWIDDESYGLPPNCEREVPPELQDRRLFDPKFWWSSIWDGWPMSGEPVGPPRPMNESVVRLEPKESPLSKLARSMPPEYDPDAAEKAKRFLEGTNTGPFPSRKEWDAFLEGRVTRGPEDIGSPEFFDWVAQMKKERRLFVAFPPDEAYTEGSLLDPEKFEEWRQGAMVDKKKLLRFMPTEDLMAEVARRTVTDDLVDE